ncbi:MAG TPA: HAMP domain-containing sensor histidine kinase [Chitinophagales bacterium]|nr:HAMP domain-containing sensor histidine kinase [Chitinophagales bacterium]
MKIRNKILIYFSSTIIVLLALTFSSIYIFYLSNREEEFQQRQKQKISNTLYFLYEIKKTDNELIEAIDQLTINDLFDEKLLLFNENKELIYSSIDDTPVVISKDMLSELNINHQWIETKDGLYDVIGTYIEKDGSIYYGISKAYDTFGYAKLYFLRNTLLIAFFIITASIFLVSFYLAKVISDPLSKLAHLLNSYRLDENPTTEKIKTTTDEIIDLNDKFNELIKRTQESFAFQKQSIQHISHQLKTPIAVLTSELERIKNIKDQELIIVELDQQIIKTKFLADIINMLLEISKAETGQTLYKKATRIDEVIFDCIEELRFLYPDFNFNIRFVPLYPDADLLVLNINEMLIKQALMNLMSNCIAYSNEPKAEIKINCLSKDKLKISIINQGNPLTKEEEKYIFQHFFRGQNSQGKIGFGLGLVLTQKIVALHSGNIQYSNPKDHINVFEISIPFS